MRKQESIPFKPQRPKAKKVGLETRKLILREEMKAVAREEKKRVKNKRRYYLHRKCRECGLQVRATKWMVVAPQDPGKKQLYYMGKLMEIGYSVQEVIS